MREAHCITYWELWLHRAIQALIMFARVWVTVVSQQGSKPMRYFSFSCADVFCYLQMYCPSYLNFPSKKHTHDHTYSTYWLLPSDSMGPSERLPWCYTTQFCVCRYLINSKNNFWLITQHWFNNLSLYNFVFWRHSKLCEVINKNAESGVRFFFFFLHCT